MRLRLEVRGARHQDHAGEPPGFLDWFEDLTLAATDLETGVETILFQDNWWLGPLLQWLASNEVAVRNDEPVVAQLPGETIGQTSRRARNLMLEVEDFDLQGLVAEATDHWRFRHWISHGLSGMQGVPDLLIGRGEFGMEICNQVEDLNEPSWRMLFDPDDFFGHLPEFTYSTGGRSRGGLTRNPKIPQLTLQPDHVLRLEIDGSDVVVVATTVSTGVHRELFRHRGAPEQVVAWLMSNRGEICHGAPKIEQLPDENIGQALRRASGLVADAVCDVRMLASRTLDKYVQKHDLASAFDPQDRPTSLVLGAVVRPGVWYVEAANVPEPRDDEGAWSVRFDPEDFFANLPTS